MMHSSILKGWVGRGALSLALLAGAVAVFLMTGGLGGGGGVLAQQAACDQPPCNTSPAFDTTPDPSTRSVPENTPPGVNIGAPVSATDPEEDIEYGDTLTYSLSGTDAASFDIDESTGQLITKAPLDVESESFYTVRVKVTDSGGDGGGPK